MEPTSLDGWRSFYGIVGASAGALIGLQFVVMTLVSDIPRTRDAAHAGQTYTTPTVVHFGAVLLLSAIASAPWDGIAAITVLWGVVGTSGVLYVGFVARRLGLHTVYEAVFEDRLCHILLPLAAYATLVASAFAAYAYQRPALFLAGGAALVLLFTGIHNAWDLVTYHVFVRRLEQDDGERRP
jgi:hypothetical protein